MKFINSKYHLREKMGTQGLHRTKKECFVIGFLSVIIYMCSIVYIYIYIYVSMAGFSKEGRILIRGILIQGCLCFKAIGGVS